MSRLSNRVRNNLAALAHDLYEGDQYAMLRVAVIRAEVDKGNKVAKAAWDFFTQIWAEVKHDREGGFFQ